MVSEPGAYAPSNGIRLWYRDEGSSTGQPLLLIMGLGSQLIAWPQDLVDGLGARGYRVIRFDNRDSGLSEKFDGVPDNALAVNQDAKAAAYQLTDMAADAVGLLDHLGIDSAHIVGASLGGMIAQLVAIDYPQRTRSLCSIMSSTGAPFVGLPTLAAALAVISPVPTDGEEAVQHLANVASVIGSQTHAATEWPARLELARAGYARSFYPEGTRRQFASILAATNRTSQLNHLEVPALVIHGGEDSLINISGGRATHGAIPGSDFVDLPTMGHDLPAPLRPQIIGAIAANAGRSGKGR
jgi:pimeloyl-ACP methyl ester carboxylesterase